MPIAGGVGTLTTDQPIRTTGSKLNHATTLWDYINRAMPFGNPKSLAPDEVYALTAYVLHLNDILPLERDARPRVDSQAEDAEPRRLHDRARPRFAKPASPIRATSRACETARAKCGCPRRCRTTRATTTETSSSRFGRSAPRTEPSGRRPPGPTKAPHSGGARRPRQDGRLHGVPRDDAEGRGSGVSGNRGPLLGRQQRRRSPGSTSQARRFGRLGAGCDAPAAAVERCGREGARAMDPGRREVVATAVITKEAVRLNACRLR